MTLPFPWNAPDIPLYLVPETIARIIRAKGAAVYRISVKRTHYHYYHVNMRTRRINKELAGPKEIRGSDGKECAGRKNGRRHAAVQR